MRRAVRARLQQELGKREARTGADGERVVVVEDDVRALVGLFPLVTASQRFDSGGRADGDQAEVEEGGEAHGV